MNTFEGEGKQNVHKVLLITGVSVRESSCWLYLECIVVFVRTYKTHVPRDDYEEAIQERDDLKRKYNELNNRYRWEFTSL